MDFDSEVLDKEEGKLIVDHEHRVSECSVFTFLYCTFCKGLW